MEEKQVLPVKHRPDQKSTIARLVHARSALSQPGAPVMDSSISVPSQLVVWFQVIFLQNKNFFFF